jgi:hypothetical protein
LTPVKRLPTRYFVVDERCGEVFHVRLLIAAATRHTAAPRAILRIRSISDGGISLRVKLDPRIADLYMHRLDMPGE